MAQDLPYESNALKQTHPAHLYALARALGLSPALPQQARVLELACASGGNLIPMAFYYPHAHFVGIDISEEEITLARTMSEDLGLNNIQFLAQNILGFKATDKFDYVICHGLFSWVEENVREKVLSICSEALTENGIAYISYNTYPGWVIGNALRDLMLFAAKEGQTTKEKIAQVRTLLLALSDSLSNTSAYESLLKKEVNLVLMYSTAQLLHEHLSPSHFPLYFYQFWENLKNYGLHYLCDATFFEFKDNVFDVNTSQELDLIHHRRFRSSLLSKKKASSFASYPQMNNIYSQLSPNLHSLQIMPRFPLASDLARYQATRQPHVTNQFHENILLTPIAQALMPYLDGQHDELVLKHIVLEYIDNGELILLDNEGNQIRDHQEKTKHIAQIYHDTMLQLAQRHLLLT